MNALSTAIVTGAAGFLGSHMVDLLLSEGFLVRGIDNLVGGRLDNLDQHKNNDRFSIELMDIQGLTPSNEIFQNVDYVFHFAGKGDIVPSIEQPSDYMSANVMGTVNLLEASRHHNVSKFVYAASSSCYGIADELPTSETALINPLYPYALSKYMGEESVLHWERCTIYP